MYKKVIWATDGSALADEAMPEAKALVLSSGGELIVLHAVQVTGPHEEGTSQPMLQTEGKTHEKLVNQVRELADSGISVTLETPSCPVDHVASSIAEFAKERKADVIVIGTRGQTVLRGLLVGSIAMRLLHITHIPVLVVPPAGVHRE
jgi:nucleotide-binding universal stress UspA family protein